MRDRLTERLNGILPKITSDEFLSGKGLGNEIAFYIFDYPPEEELRVREHIDFLIDQLSVVAPKLRVKTVSLFQLVVSHIEKRGYLEEAFRMQESLGEAKLLSELSKLVSPEKLKIVFVAEVNPEDLDLVILHGVGGTWPVVRSHTLLNNLHPVMGDTPLVMFFPGKYSGQSLHLFDCITDENYYRAFKLIP